MSVTFSLNCIERMSVASIPTPNLEIRGYRKSSPFSRKKKGLSLNAVLGTRRFQSEP
jgi:hypothetical protein